MITKETPSYYAIIPANVRYDKELKANEKLLYWEITCLSQTTGECFAANKYFAELYWVTVKCISTWISNLKSKWYINTRLVYKENSKEVLYRFIEIGLKPLHQKKDTPPSKVPYPLHQKVKDNTIKNNNINNNNAEEENSLSLTSKVVNEVRNHMDIVNDYETVWTYNITELASKAVINTYEASGLNNLAVVFLDWCVWNKDKLEGKVNIKARFNKFVQTDYQWLLKKKSEWPGIDVITDEQFLQLMEEGHFKTWACEFYKNKVRPTLDWYWIQKFQLMIEFFRNKDVWNRQGLSFNERLEATGKVIA